MLEVYIAIGKRRILQKGSDNSPLQQQTRTAYGGHGNFV
jgi:hypothetical protein